MITAGLALRLVRENFYLRTYDGMESLGWFDQSQSYTTNPVEMRHEPVDQDESITPNKIALASEDITPIEWEMGSDMDQMRWDMFLDIFAEDESTGIHLAGDLYSVLTGKIPGRQGSTFPVYDRTKASEPILFYCDLENIDIGRVREWKRPHERYWFTVGCTVVYYDSGDLA